MVDSSANHSSIVDEMDTGNDVSSEIVISALFSHWIPNSPLSMCRVCIETPICASATKVPSLRNNGK